MKCISSDYIKYFLFALLFVSVFHGVDVQMFSQGIIFNIADFVFAVLFLLSMIIISIISVNKGKSRNCSKIFLFYWISVIIIYNISEIFSIDLLETTAEFIISPFKNIFYILWRFTDGETATVISLLSAYYVLPFIMNTIFFSMILKR